MLGPDGLYPNYRLLILAVCGALTFLLTFYTLIHKYMSYVRMLERAMRDIANGDLNQEIPVENLDEFGEIARYMNQMERHVKDLMEREREAERTKNDLVTSVAHDLRTPLTSVIGYLDWVRNKPDLDEQVRQQYLDIAYRKAIHLEQLTALKTLSEAEDLGVILRAKGMVDGKDGQWIYFDMVPEEYEVRTGTPQITGKICVIGSKMAEDKIAEIFGVNE